MSVLPLICTCICYIKVALQTLGILTKPLLYRESIRYPCYYYYYDYYLFYYNNFSYFVMIGFFAYLCIFTLIE